MYLFITLLAFFAIIPSMVLLAINWKNINKGTLAIVIGILFVIGIVWDWIAVDHGVWTFFSGELIGIFIGILPLEEYIFIAFVSLLAINAFVFAVNANKAIKAKNASCIIDATILGCNDGKYTR